MITVAKPDPIILRAERDKNVTGADRFIRYESFKTWAWMNAVSQEQFDAMCRQYREAIGL